MGKPDAKVNVHEYFSLTCTHCAAFAARHVPPDQGEADRTGTVRWVFHDYPLDQLALTAAMVARYLPVDRYEPFINALFATQNRWAFTRGGNPTDELWKTAALAGMSRATFDQAISDDGLASGFSNSSRPTPRNGRSTRLRASWSGTRNMPAK